MTTQKISVLMGVFGVAVLAGCASKPTYQSTQKTAPSKTVATKPASPKITLNEHGVPNIYMVKQGDTVGKIAQRFGLNWQEIGKLNNLNSQYTIYTGQWLTLWQGAAKPAVTPQPAKQSTAIVTTTITKPAVQPTTQTAVAPTKQTAPIAQTVQTTSIVPNVQTAPVATPAPLSIGSVGLMQFRYPVANSNPIVRQFGVMNSQGMWFSGKIGDVVKASRDGTVIHADGNMNGAMIAIAHADGFTSNYIHIKDATVKAGDSVKAGQNIASMGLLDNGSSVLEFRISRNASYIDPISVLK